MSNYEDNNNEDITYEEEVRLNKWKHIKHFTLNDYLSCNQTKELLLQEWDKRIYDDLEPDIINIMKRHIQSSKDNMSNILYRAEERHINDLIMLIKHHIVEDYDLKMFEENPELADPLVNSIGDIRKRQKELIKQQQLENFKNTNKVFNWGK